MDRRLLKIILRQLFNQRLISEPNFQPTAEDIYQYPGNLDKAQFISYIQAQPIIEHPSLFGMHSNSNIKVSLGESNAICYEITKLLPKNRGDGTDKPEDIIKQKCQNMFELLDINLDYDAAIEKYPVSYLKSMHIVLH